MKKYGMLALSALSLLLCTTHVLAAKQDIAQQENPVGSTTIRDRRCGTDFAMTEHYQYFPDAKKQNDIDMAQAQKSLAARHSDKLGALSPTTQQALSTTPTYIIPVVFHVYGTVFNGKVVNDAIIIDALRRTNEDFQGQTADYADVISEFSTIKKSLSIEFRLATRDPNGNPTTGIVYHPVKSGYGNGSGYDSQIAADAWDNYKYMNIYIQNDLYADGTTNNSGVAWYPDTTMSNQNTARVVYNGAYLGANTDENFRSVLTHEFGHFINLIHTFEGGCRKNNETRCSSTGDKICDTPQVNSSSWGTKLNCVGKVTNWQNFMNYSSQYANYTTQQVSRMITALNVPSRVTLWSAANLVATGTNY